MNQKDKTALISWAIENLKQKPTINLDYGVYRIKHFAGTSLKRYVPLEQMCEVMELLGFTIVIKKDSLYTNAYLRKTINQFKQ